MPCTNHCIAQISLKRLLTTLYLLYLKQRKKLWNYGSKELPRVMLITYNETHAVPGNSFSFLFSQLQGNFHQQHLYEWQKLSSKSRSHLEQRYSSCCHSYSGKASFHEQKGFSTPGEITSCMSRTFSKVEQQYASQRTFKSSKSYNRYNLNSNTD